MKFLTSPLFVIIVGIGFMGTSYFYFLSEDESTSFSKEYASKDCDTTKEVIKIYDGSMEDLYNQNDMVEVEMGYYKCNHPKQGDIVAMKAAGKIDPIVRVVQVTPQDSFKIVRDGLKFIFEVNGDAMETPKGTRYLFSERKVKLLKLYEDSLKGIMADNVFFVFSLQTSGGFDSTRFGPVERANIVGRVISN